MINRKRPDWLPAAYATKWSEWQPEIERASTRGWRASLGFGFAMAGCAAMAMVMRVSPGTFVDAALRGPAAVEELRLMMRASNITGFNIATIQAAAEELRSAPPLDTARVAELQKVLDGE